jgi:tetratricopeptide (TPR) repeat protein
MDEQSSVNQSTPIVLDSGTLVKTAEQLLHDGSLMDAIALAKRVLKKTDLPPEQLDIAYQVLTAALNSMEQYEEDLRYCDEWLSRTERAYGRCGALLARASVYRRQGRVTEAQQTLDEVIALAEATGEQRQLGVALRNRADSYWMQGDHEKALVLLRQAYLQLEAVNDIRAQINVLISTGIVYHMMGRYYQVIQTLQRATSLSVATSDQVSRWLIFNNMGEAYQRLYALEDALRCHLTAKELRRGVAMMDLERNIGVDLVGLGRYDEGLEHLQLAYRLAEQNGDKEVLLQILYSIADTELQQGKLDIAEQHTQRLHDEAIKLSSRTHTARALLLRGQLARAHGDEKQAEVHFTECSWMAQQSSERELIWMSHAALSDMLTKTNPPLADVHRMMAVEILDGIAQSIEDRILQHTFQNAPPVRRLLNPAGKGDPTVL